MQIPVYKAERDAGLEQKVRSTSSIAFASAVRMSVDRPTISEQAMAALRKHAPERAKAAMEDMDLHYIDSILVSVGWNKNDDVFDGIETWVARLTPTHKQLNYEHDCAQIVGHIIKCSAIDADGKMLAEDAVIDDLPAKFHLLTGGVLYKYWAKEDLQERMDTLLAEIAKNEWFVSMECLFKGFDYALKARDGSCRIVARNEQTAFLTKHLRAYEGTGQYGEYRVGRLVRNIIFSGKGLVKNPANPESVILPEPENFTAAHAEVVTDFSQVRVAKVYGSSEQVSETTKEREQTMAIEVETIQKQLDALKSENEQLKASLAETNIKEHKARAEKAEADKAQADELLKKAHEAVKQAEAKTVEASKEVETIKAKLTDAEKSLAEIKEELSGIYAEQKKAVRLTKVKAAMKVADGDAEALKRAAAFAENLSELSDEKFDAALASVNMMTMPPATNNPASGNTAFPHSAPKVAPKATGNPVGPKATSLPAPMAGAPMVTALGETDVSGEQTVAGANLDQVEPDRTAALSTTVGDSGVNDVQKAIAAYFGVVDEESGEEA